MSAHSRPGQSRPSTEAPRQAAGAAQRQAGNAAQRQASTAAQQPASTAAQRPASTSVQQPAGNAAQRPGSTARTAEAERLTALLEPVAAAMGMDLEGVRITTAGRRRLLRITVDADGGVSLDDVQKVSRLLSGALDENPVMGEAPYTLEVSSPGVDRPLTEPRHWRRAAGRLVQATVLAPAEPGQEQDGPAAPGATVQGRVLRAGELGVTLDIDGSAQQFRYGELGPGRIQIEFGHPASGPDDGADEGTDEEEPDGY